jgi:hypothetical protein
MLVGFILIILGIVFAVLGWGGTATLKIEGFFGFTLVIGGIAGIIMIVVGVIFLAVPDVITSSFIMSFLL